MTAVDREALAAEIRDRLDAQVAASITRREQRSQQRDQLAERRTAGLRRRHARKLGRRSDTPDTPDGYPAPPSVPRVVRTPVRTREEGHSANP